MVDINDYLNLTVTVCPQWFDTNVFENLAEIVNEIENATFNEVGLAAEYTGNFKNGSNFIKETS